MEVFVARQPIFDRLQRVFAFELLYRSGQQDQFDPQSDPDRATSSVIVNSFTTIGIQKLTDGKKAFVNFTRQTLLGEIASLFPQEHLAVEVLENVEPDAEIVERLRDLKKRGYTIALDDFVYAEKFEALLPLADIVKVDFMRSTPQEWDDLAKRLLPRGIALLAEKVETQSAFEEGVRLGYSYFQGYFFSKPVVVQAKEVPGLKIRYLQVLREVNREPMKYDQIEHILKREISLSFRLLKLVNSPIFGQRVEIKSIGHALVVLGERETRRWINLIAMIGLGDDKPPALVMLSIIRARFLELIAPLFKLPSRSQDLFLTGMFSMIDAIVGRPTEEVLSEISLHRDVKETLLGRKTPLSDVYCLALAYEKGEWALVSEQTAKFGVGEQTIPPCYIEAVQWAHELVVGPGAPMDGSEAVRREDTRR